MKLVHMLSGLAVAVALTACAKKPQTFQRLHQTRRHLRRVRRR
jgi:uncharacterized lipoprotein YbaY